MLHTETWGTWRMHVYICLACHPGLCDTCHVYRLIHFQVMDEGDLLNRPAINQHQLQATGEVSRAPTDALEG